MKAVKNWHAVEGDAKQPVDGQGRPELAIYSLNTRNKIALRAASDHGGFSTRDLDTLSYVLREPSSGNQHPIDPALADLVYRIQTHFDAPEIRVVSCYRTPRRGHASNHGLGRAIDIIVPGATDDAVAKFAREQGFVGVGLYPTSGFVHVDVRQRSYFWIDSSGPGRRNRERGVFGDLAKKSDAAAIARGEHGAPSLLLGSVDAMLKSTDASAASSAMTDEEDEDSDPPPVAPAPE
ncbi:MAG: YcbK family protein [Polyangiaceae bacterium]